MEGFDVFVDWGGFEVVFKLDLGLVEALEEGLEPFLFEGGLGGLGRRKLSLSILSDERVSQSPFLRF